MRYVLGCLFIAVVVTFATAVIAAPVGNIARPAMLKSAWIAKAGDDVQIGVTAEGEFDLTFDRNVDGSNDEMELWFTGGKLGLIYMDKFMVDGFLGSAYYEEEDQSQGSTFKVESELDFAWGVGVTLIIYEDTIIQLNDGILRIGASGRYRQTELDIDKVIVDGTEYSLPHGALSNMNLEYEDWQVALGASLEWNELFVPYGGVKYSTFNTTAQATVSGTTYSFSDVEPDSNIGIFIGTDIRVFDSLSFNVEGRFIDETALSAGGMLRF
jgi:hypothetical protein